MTTEDALLRIQLLEDTVRAHNAVPNPTISKLREEVAKLRNLLNVSEQMRASTRVTAELKLEEKNELVALRESKKELDILKEEFRKTELDGYKIVGKWKLDMYPDPFSGMLHIREEDFNELGKRISAAFTNLKQTVAAQKEYLRHKEGCQNWRAIVGCDCGLTELEEKL